MIDWDLPSHPRRLERLKGHPEGVLNLRAEDNGRPLGQREYKWADDDGREHRRPRVEVVEDSEALRGRQIDADFFACFADRSGQQVGVGRFATPPGKRDLSRPRITRPHSAVDEQRFETPAALVQDHCHRRRNHSAFDLDGCSVVLAQDFSCSVQHVRVG